MKNIEHIFLSDNPPVRGDKNGIYFIFSPNSTFVGIFLKEADNILDYTTDVSSLLQRVNDLELSVQTINQSIQTLNREYTDLQNDVANSVTYIQGVLNNMSDYVSELSLRVRDLENGNFITHT